VAVGAGDARFGVLQAVADDVALLSAQQGLLDGVEQVESGAEDDVAPGPFDDVGHLDQVGQVRARAEEHLRGRSRHGRIDAVDVFAGIAGGHAAEEAVEELEVLAGDFRLFHDMDDVGLAVDGIGGEIGRAGEEGDRETAAIALQAAEHAEFVMKDGGGDAAGLDVAGQGL